jgi:hypothetical protein
MDYTNVLLHVCMMCNANTSKIHSSMHAYTDVHVHAASADSMGILYTVYVHADSDEHGHVGAHEGCMCMCVQLCVCVLNYNCIIVSM